MNWNIIRILWLGVFNMSIGSQATQLWVRIFNKVQMAASDRATTQRWLNSCVTVLVDGDVTCTVPCTKSFLWARGSVSEVVFSTDELIRQVVKIVQTVALVCKVITGFSSENYSLKTSQVETIMSTFNPPPPRGLECDARECFTIPMSNTGIHYPQRRLLCIDVWALAWL